MQHSTRISTSFTTLYATLLHSSQFYTNFQHSTRFYQIYTTIYNYIQLYTTLQNRYTQQKYFQKYANFTRLLQTSTKPLHNVIKNLSQLCVYTTFIQTHIHHYTTLVKTIHKLYQHFYTIIHCYSQKAFHNAIHNNKQYNSTKILYKLYSTLQFFEILHRFTHICTTLQNNYQTLQQLYTISQIFTTNTHRYATLQHTQNSTHNFKTLQNFC